LASQPDNAVLVTGLGRFGSSTAESLVRLGHEVLAIDTDPGLVQRYADSFTHVVEADSTSSAVLRQLGAGDFAHAVVGIGNVEASVLTVLELSELEVPHIWAKAVTAAHGRILERVGAHHVVYPEIAMGERVAHLVTEKLLDFIEFDDDFALVKTATPADAADRTLEDVGLRRRFGVTVVGVKRPGGEFVTARPETVVRAGDLLIVCGTNDQVSRYTTAL